MTSPTLTSFQVSLGPDSNFFTLTFSEIVDSSMLQYAEITLSDSAASTNTLALTGGTVINEVYNVIDISFTAADLASLTAGPVTCGTVDACFISLTADFAQDYSGNLVEPANAVQVREYDTNIVLWLSLLYSFAGDCTRRWYVTSQSISHSFVCSNCCFACLSEPHIIHS